MKTCKHKFQPRYDETYTTTIAEVVPHLTGKISCDREHGKPYLKTKTYVHDICVKCGMKRVR